MGALSSTCTLMETCSISSTNSVITKKDKVKQEEVKVDVGYESASKVDIANDTKSDSVITRNEYIRRLSNTTKKHIAASHLFGVIWHQYFMSEDNKCEYMDYEDRESYFDILDHVFVRGGACRDAIWRKDFNDVDVVVNTRELNKLHLLHLKKYHSTRESQENTNCVLWSHYAIKYDLPQETTSGFEHDTKGIRIAQSQYMLNAGFLSDIIQSNKLLKDKVSVVSMQFSDGPFVRNIKIIDKIVYAGYDLTGFDMDLMDIFHGDIKLAVKKEAIQKIHLTRQHSLGDKRHSHRAFNSIQLKSKLKLYGTNVEDDTAKSVDLPIYPLNFIKITANVDLTVNSMIIHFSDIIKGQYNEYQFDEKEVDYDWRAKVKNPLMGFDAIKDCEERNIRVFSRDTAGINQVLGAQAPRAHIWRIVKMWAKLKGNATLDPLLAKCTIAMYPKWFTPDLMNKDDKHCQWVAKRFTIYYAKRGQYKWRFECLQMLEFDAICRDMLEKSANFKKHCMEFIENMEDEELKKELKTELKQYGYNI